MPNNYWMSYRKLPTNSWQLHFSQNNQMSGLKIRNADKIGRHNCVTLDLKQDKYYAKDCEDLLAFIC